MGGNNQLNRPEHQTGRSEVITTAVTPTANPRTSLQNTETHPAARATPPPTHNDPTTAISAHHDSMTAMTPTTTGVS